MDQEMSRTELAAQFRAARGYAGMTTTELAAAIGVAARSVRAWESGQIPVLPGRADWITKQIEKETGYPIRVVQPLIADEHHNLSAAA